MPDPLDFDGARRALDDVPAPDLWADASQRAEAGAVVPLPAGSGDRARRPRWLVAVGVAAVAVLAVGTSAALLADDDQSVDTTPVTESPSGTGDPTTVTGGVCMVGITGEPIVMDAGPAADPPRFDLSGQPANQLVAHTMLGSQVAELHVPGVVLTDLVGERVEDVELERGTASIWFGPDFVQVRWFPGEQEPCESFTVTVSGGSEDANRHAAVDFAERILLPSDLRDMGTSQFALGTIEGEWQLESSEVDGAPTEGDGLVFTLADGEATWTDGCNTFAGGYAQTGSADATDLAVVTFTDVTSTDVGCSTNPTAQAVQQVMGADQVDVSRDGDLLVLSANGASLTLRSLAADDGPSAGPELAGTEWRVAALYHGDELVLPRPAAGELAFSFGESRVAWDDGCNSAGGTWSVDGDGYIVITDAVSTAIGCVDVGEGTQVWEVIGAVMQADRIYMDEMGGQLELSDTEGNHLVLEPV